jgi:predicted small lipoprotein YifL
MRIRMLTTLLFAALLATLSACGTKGALYLPEKPVTTQAAAQ